MKKPIEPGRLSQDREGRTPRAHTCPECGVPNGHFGWCKRTSPPARGER